MSTVAVILAHDSADGVGGSRFLLPIDGPPMLEHIVREAVTWPVDDVVVVLGDRAEEVMDGCSLDGATIVIDPEWEEGRAAPMRAALDLVSRDRSCRRVVVARGDQPGVGADVVASLLDASDESQAVVPKYRYAVGWPVVVSRGLWDLFLGLEGAIDIHDVLRSHVGGVTQVWCDQLAPTIVRTPDDLPSRRR